MLECHLYRIKVNRAGYDAYGAYYGAGCPVWAMRWQGDYAGVRDLEFRSANLQNARKYVRDYAENRCLGGDLVKFVR